MQNRVWLWALLTLSWCLHTMQSDSPEDKKFLRDVRSFLQNITEYAFTVKNATKVYDVAVAIRHTTNNLMRSAELVMTDMAMLNLAFIKVSVTLYFMNGMAYFQTRNALQKALQELNRFATTTVASINNHIVRMLNWIHSNGAIPDWDPVTKTRAFHCTQFF